MASNNEEFIQYQIFLKNITESMSLHDSEVPMKGPQMRNRIVCSSDAQGEVIYWILIFLDEKKCPTKLIPPIVRHVLDDIESDPRYKDPNDLRSLATSIVEGFCARLLNNVELNKIIDTATSQQLNDDLLSIPIRTAKTLKNSRRKMEDRTICIDEFHKVYDMKNSSKTSFYGVFDGHNGYAAAHYTASQLPFNISHTCDSNPIDVLRTAFHLTDKNFISKGNASGTTAVCALYRPEEKRLFIAWAGDSKAMLAKQHGKIKQLVTPHRPDLEREKHRIESLGGVVNYSDGSYRVNATSNVTRSIGDNKMKTLLVSHPDCVEVMLDLTEDFLVLATDGLWDHALEKDIAKTVYDCIKEDCENLDQIPNRLIKLALDGKSTDNISVVVIFFKHPSQIAKNCNNLTIMESEFDNIKEVDYYNSKNFYPSDENTTSNNSHAIDSKQMRWSPSDNLNNIISDEVKQTTTTTTTTTTSSNNGQFDDNLLHSSDNIDLNQKLSPLVGCVGGDGGDDNNVHHALTLENNGEEFLATGYDNKNGELLTPTSLHHHQFDDNVEQQQNILEKIQPQQHLVDTEADYGPETCVDVTDDVVMMTENSADTNNLSEQSTLSHSKDTLPSSDNCNPFDNKNALDMEDANEYQLGIAGVDAHHLHLDDANKATPLLSPEVEELPLSSDGVMHFTNEGYQQSPLDDEIPVSMNINSHHQFEDENMQSNGHLSPTEGKDSAIEKAEYEQQEEIDSLAKLQRFGGVEENTIAGVTDMKPELVENFYGNPTEPMVREEENLFDNSEGDENDFRSKDEEEIPEKYVVESEKKLEALDLSQRDQLQQSLHNLEDDVLEEKPILTGVTELSYDQSSMHSDLEDEEKLGEFAEEKQDKEEFSEKEDKMEDKLSFVEQKSTPIEEIELDEENCIHLEEDVRPSDYLAMLERQKDEHQHLSQVAEGFEKEGQQEEEEANIKTENNYELQKEEENMISEKIVHEDAVEEHSRSENEIGKGVHDADEKLDEQVEEINKNAHYDMDDSLSLGAEQQEEERNLDDIEKMSQQFERFEKEDGLKENEQLDNESVTEMVLNEQRYDVENFEEIEELQKQLQQPVEPSTNEQVLEDNRLVSEAAAVIDEISSLVEESIETEKQCFEEPEKIHEEPIPVDEQMADEMVQQKDEQNNESLLTQELENKFLDEQIPDATEKVLDNAPEFVPSQEINDLVQQLEEHNLIDELENNYFNDQIVEEPEKQLVESTEKILYKIEQQVLDTSPIPADQKKKDVQQIEIPEYDPDNLVEVEEPVIIKEKVQIKPTALQFSAEEEPLAVPPTRESGNESEDDEQKYTNESQGLPFKLDTQGDIVLPQMLGCIDLNRQTSGNILQEQISLNTSNLIESINDDTFEGLTQNITELSSAAPTESKEEAIEQGIHNLNLSQSSTREKLDNLEDDEDLSAAEMNSRLNPEAKEFVPTLSPPAASEFSNGFGGTAPTAIPPHFKDELIAQSPRKGRESDMEDIKIPAENEFEEEIAHKPHGLAGEEAIVEPSENGGGLFQEMNWKEAMHGSEKEEGPLVDSPVTEESLEIVDDNQQYDAVSNVCEMSAPVDLDNAGMKQSIYIENNTSQTSSDDVLNHVQVLPDENESEHNSFEIINKEEQDVISKEGVQEILRLASEENIEKKIEEQIEQRMEHLLLSHDKEFTKDVQLETETQQGPINGVEMAPEPTAVSDELILVAEPVSEQPKESSASGIEAHEALALGAAVAAVAAVTTTAAVKKVEAEKNQKNLKKTSSATKSKVPDTKKPAAVPTAKTSTVSSVAAKRTLADKPKPAAASSLATKKATSSTLSAAAPRPKTAPASGNSKAPTEKKPTTTTTTSTVKSRIDAKPPTTLATRKPLVSSATKTTTSKPAESSSTTTNKSSNVAKTSLGSKPTLGSTKTSSATNSISKPRPATASSAATTNGTANKTAVTSKPTTLAPKSAAPTKPSITSPRGTLTSTLRKTEAVKSPTKTTSSTTTSRISSSNGVTKSTTTTRTTTTKTTSAPSAAARTSTTRLAVTGTTTTGGATTPNSKTNNLVPRKSTPLKKTITNSSTTPTARKSIGSKLNSPATKPTKDTSTPRPVTIPSQHQNTNSKIVEPLVEIALPIDEPKLNGNASPDDVTLPTEAPAAPPNPLEMETA